jgi:RND family efflux transporter MFP subunit
LVRSSFIALAKPVAHGKGFKMRNEMNIAYVIIGQAAIWTTLAIAASAQEISVDSILLTVAHQADVAAREAGTLAEVKAREGQIVTAGDTLARLDDEEAVLARDRCEIELERVRKLANNTIKIRLAKKELEIAQADLKRATDAADRFNNSVTQAELDRLKLDVDRAQLQVEQTEFELDTARLSVRGQENELSLATAKLRRRQLIAPISGIVVSVQRRLGESVEPGQVVARMIGMDTLRAEGFLNVELVTANLVGRKVDLTVRLPGAEGQLFPGGIVYVNPEVDPVNGQIRIWAEIENSDHRLRPGLVGSMKILAGN